MVRIKKHSITVLYISFLYIGGLLLLSSLYFIFDHQTIIKHGLAWLFGAVPAGFFATYILINLLYNLCCKTYYVFRENEIVLIKKGQVEKSIKLQNIKKIVYEKCSMYILIGSGSLGELMIIYEENNEIYRHRIEIPFRMLKKTYLYQKKEIIIGNI